MPCLVCKMQANMVINNPPKKNPLNPPTQMIFMKMNSLNINIRSILYGALIYHTTHNLAKKPCRKGKLVIRRRIVLPQNTSLQTCLLFFRLQIYCKVHCTYVIFQLYGRSFVSKPIIQLELYKYLKQSIRWMPDIETFLQAYHECLILIHI